MGRNSGMCFTAHPVNSQNPKPLQPVHADLTGSDTCTALGITAHSTIPVLRLCRMLLATGHDPDTPLEAWRGATLCLTVRSIGEAAHLRVGTHGSGFEPIPRCTGGPPVNAPSKNDRTATNGGDP